VDWTQVNPYSFMTIEESQGNSPGSRPLMEEIMGNTQYRNLYTHILEYYRDNITDLSLWESHLDNLKAIIAPWAELDTFRMLDYGFSIPDFHQSYSHNPYANQHVKKGLKQFTNERHASLDNQLVYETAPPIIYDLQYWPLIPGPDDSIYVSVAAFSDVGIDSLTIAYHPGVLNVVMSYPMHFTPLENPQSIEESDRWVGVIPPLGELGHGRFQVGAVDLNGQNMLYPRSDFEYIQVPGSSLNPLRINEFLADNVTANPDAAGEYDDWLEIFNTGSSPIYLGGMYLTDDATNLTKWMFPFGGVALEADGYLLVWCDEDQEQADLHCNFKLSRHGEFIALVDTDGLTIIDALNFGPQQQDVSYGRSPDGGMDWVNFDNPSPGASNGTVDLIVTQVVPENFYLNNYPNPFNAETILRYKLPESGFIELVILDLNGREIKKLVTGVKSSGENSIAWNGLDESGSNVSAGIYFVKLVQGNFTTTHKILLLK